MNIKDIEKLKHIHFTGIKGVGMTALALCMKDMGKKVTGSDVTEVFVTDEVLKKNKILWDVGFGDKNLRLKPDLLVYTAGHGGILNPEVRLAQEKGVLVKSYAEFVADLANTKKVISVCGVGGKTSTASMVSVLLESANINPSYIVGVGSIFPLGNAGHYEEKGEYFVCEADDYVVSPGVDNRPKFMLLNPYIAVVTNIEYDHPDIYFNFEETITAFRKFFEKIPKNGVLIACTDNQNVAKIIKDLKKPILTYGIKTGADYRIANIKFKDQKTYFDILVKGSKKTYKDIIINVPGEFNVRNAVAAFVVGDFLGMDEKDLRFGLAKYQGCRRRFEKMGEYKGGLFFDDYAHHPSEIISIIKATRDWYSKKRIVVIFQPHTFSRTKALFSDFSKAFKHANAVGFMDIYPSARESFDATISSEMLSIETSKYQDNVNYLGNHESTLKWIDENIKKGDIVLTLGAGDIFHLYNCLSDYPRVINPRL